MTTVYPGSTTVGYKRVGEQNDRPEHEVECAAASATRREILKRGVQMEAALVRRLIRAFGLATATILSLSSESRAQGGDPLSVLGKSVDSDEAKALLGAFDERCSFDRGNLYQCPREGLAVAVRFAKNGGKVIQQVLIKVTPVGSMNAAYVRPLPFGLALDDHRQDVRAKLGRPDAIQADNDYYERNPRISIDYIPETGDFPGLISQIKLYRR